MMPFEGIDIHERDRAVLLSRVESYRAIARAAIHALHDAYRERYRLKARVRELSEHRRKAGGEGPGGICQAQKTALEKFEAEIPESS